MRIAPNVKANRIHGTLTIELGDGREATLEVNLDVSSDTTKWSADRHYGPDGEPHVWGPKVGAIPDSTTYSIRVRPEITTSEPQFVLTLPTESQS